MNEPLDPEYTSSLWERALDSLENAEVFQRHPDWAANRAYYAVFYAVSALFAREGLYFKRHAGLRVAFHQHLINTNRFDSDLGRAYDQLLELRAKADYGVTAHAMPEEIAHTVSLARRIVISVHEAYPGIFPFPPHEKPVAEP